LSNLHTDWSKIGVNRSVEDKTELSSIFSILKKTLTPKKASYGWYMHDGIQALPNALVQRIRAHGGQVHTGVSIASVQLDGGKIVSVTSGALGTQTYDHVVWTGQPNDLATMVLGQTFQMHFLTNIFYNIMIKGSQYPNFQWMYYVDDTILFNRLYNTIRFSPTHAPEGCFGYCAEVTCRSGAEMENHPERYIDRVVGDLKKTRAIYGKDELLGVRTEVKNGSYPLYTLGYRKELTQYIGALYDTCSNLTIAGRSGMFWYNNVDHTLDNAFEASDALLEGTRFMPKIILE
jgi:protoporphyrinogen oxidase